MTLSSSHIPHEPVIILMPAKNESASIGKVISDIRQYFQGTVLVINDASTDDTAFVAEQAGAQVISLEFSLGAWGAMQTGLRYAFRHGYHTALTMDADGQHEASTIPILLNALKENSADVIIGAFPQRGSRARRVAWSLFRWISGLTLADLTSGLRVYNFKAIKLLASKAATLLDYQDMGVLMLLQQAGLKLREVEITMRLRENGHSRIFSSWWVVFNYMLYTLILSLARAKYIEFKRKRPPVSGRLLP